MVNIPRSKIEGRWLRERGLEAPLAIQFFAFPIFLLALLIVVPIGWLNDVPFAFTWESWNRARKFRG